MTDDGYMLCLYNVKRINGFNDDNGNGMCKGVVLLQHAMLCSCIDFIVNGMDSVVYQLIIDGYDVWIGNNRCNEFSKCVNDDDSEVKWSFHEMGIYDLTAILDHIRHVYRGQKDFKIIYYGISQGALQLLLLLSLKPEYNKYISKAVLSCAPIVFQKRPGLSILLYVLTKCPPLIIHIVFWIIAFIRDNTPSPLLFIVFKIVLFILKFSLNCPRNEAFDLRLKHMATGTPPISSILHYYYAFTSSSRMICDKYKQECNLANIKIPIYLIYGDQDNAVDIKQSIKIAKQKLNIMNCKILKNSSHFDVGWSDTGRQSIFNAITNRH